jgi:glycosyltransferase involved in cell wall biosynthesis
MQTYLSVVIPCYNEEKNIRLGALDKVARYMEHRPYSWEVLVVDDGSEDQSLPLIKKFIASNKGFRVIANPHQGKAATVVKGMLSAKADYVLFCDLDQATPVDQIEKLIPWLDKGFDIVIGSRHSRRLGAPLLRRLMGPGFMIIRNLILGLHGIDDTQCGFKLFRQVVAHKIFNKLALYKKNKIANGPRVTAGFDVEVLFVGQTLGYKIKEVPVEWHYVETRRVSPFSDSLDALIDIIRIRVNSFRGIYST